MIHKTKRHLLFLYTISTGLILTTVIAILAYSDYRRKEQDNLFLFRRMVYSFSLAIQNTPDLQKVGELYAKGSRLSFRVFMDNEEIMLHSDDSAAKDILLSKALEESGAGAIIAIRAVSSQESSQENTGEKAFTGNVLKLHSRSGKPFFGSVLELEKTDGSYAKVYLVHPANSSPSLRSVSLYLLLELSGMFLLWGTGKLLIDRIFKPVNQNIQNQKDFISYASHELKAPLAIIQASNSSSERASADARAAISNACNNMSRLISDMLLLASTENANMPLCLTSVEISTLLIKVYETYLPLCRESNHILELNLPDDLLPEIVLDEAKILQVLSILINNAISYSPADSTITLSADLRIGNIPAKKMLCIKVADHGTGIPDDEKRKVFDRFYRIDKSHNDRQHYGLGLSIARNIVLLHKGTLEIRDTEGGGSTFCIIFPLG